MTDSPIIYWFRNDLRIHDNPVFLKTLKTGRPIIPVFVIEDIWFNSEHPYLGFPRTGSNRKQFLAETLQDLKKVLEELGNTLYIFKGNTVKILKEIAEKNHCSKIIAQKEFAWEEIKLEQAVSANISPELYWGSMLYQPDQVDFPVEKSPFYYTKFKNKVLGQSFTPQPSAAPTVNKVPLPKEKPIFSGLNFFNPEEWIQPSPPAPFKGGESEGLKRMDEYLNSGGAEQYVQTRNQFEGKNFSTQLGPWLANGSLSPRTLFAELIKRKSENASATESIDTLIEQLLWRDNFRFLFLRYGKKFFSTTGLRKTPHGMYDDKEAFEMWRSGQTGKPIIDALMHELEATGFMSNRGRMLVSFYLAKELKVNWQWGAAWFESMLLDYDVCSNYGNWAYQSGRGTDSRVNRKFNLETQVKKFDPKGTFIQKWRG